MTRRVKKGKAQAGAQERLVLEEYSESDLPRPKAGKQNKPSSTLAKKSKVSTNADDEFVSQRLPTQKRVERRSKRNGSQIVKALEVVAASMGDIDNVDDWLEEHGIQDDFQIKSLHKVCAKISTWLTTKELQAAAENQMSGTLEGLDQYFVFRNQSTVMLLTPLQVFKCNKTYKRTKVLGFLQYKLEGEQYPEMIFSFPGWTNCSEQHGRLLDSNTWTEKVLEFANRFEQQLTTDGFDGRHKKPPGQSFASHVEKKLMLFFACRLLGLMLDENILQVPLGWLWRLKGMAKPDVEIFISENPCQCCKKFQETLEMMTGIKFILRVCPNLGILNPTRDAKGYRKYPAFASDSSDSDGYAEVDQPARSGKLAVVIPWRVAPGTMMTVFNTENSLEKSKTSRGMEFPVTNNKKTTPRKRQYEIDEDDAPPNRTRREAGLMSPGDSPGAPSRKERFRDECLEQEGFHSRKIVGAKRRKWV